MISKRGFMNLIAYYICITIASVLIGIAILNIPTLDCKPLNQTEIENLIANGIILNIPFYNQETDVSCNHASVQMVLEYFGFKVPQNEISNTSKSMSLANASILLQNWLNEIGLNTYVELHVTFENLSYIIYNKSWPVIVSQSPGGNDHSRVVIGIDEEYVYIADPNSQCNISKIDKEVFIKNWNIQSHRLPNGTIIIYNS